MHNKTQVLDLMIKSQSWGFILSKFDNNMDNIVKELSLNKHPKEFKVLSLINERNIMVRNDFSCLQNEISITEYPTLQDI